MTNRKNMKICTYVLMIFLIHFACKAHSQTKLIRLIYGDSLYMKKSGNGLTYIFKKGIEDGIYIAFYDSLMKDSAIMCNVSKGLIEGTLKRWDTNEKYIDEICEYKLGKMNGIRYLYFYADGQVYTNIEKYENNVLIKHVQIEF